jgi:hypothetical protein
MALPQLTLYNDALLLAGERFLASLTEEREPRRLLDQVWGQAADADAVVACLEMGQWNFAMRTQQIDYDTNIEPGFGYARAFDKPTDWVGTCAVCEDEFMRVPLTRYFEESGFWYSDLDTIYVRFISKDTGYGFNDEMWPRIFHEVVAEYLCTRIIRKITNSDSEETESKKRLNEKLLRAKNLAAMAQPTMFPARGQWGLARNRFPNRRDGGNINGNLIG